MPVIGRGDVTTSLRRQFALRGVVAPGLSDTVSPVVNVGREVDPPFGTKKILAGSVSTVIVAGGTINVGFSNPSTSGCVGVLRALEFRGVGFAATDNLVLAYGDNLLSGVNSGTIVSGEQPVVQNIGPLYFVTESPAIATGFPIEQWPTPTGLDGGYNVPAVLQPGQAVFLVISNTTAATAQFWVSATMDIYEFQSTKP